MPQKLKVQFGIEQYSGSRRVIRLTPLSEIMDLPDVAETLIVMLVAQVDSNDMQPGDGEADMMINEAMLAQMKKVIPSVAPLIPINGKFNAFLRVALV